MLEYRVALDSVPAAVDDAGVQMPQEQDRQPQNDLAVPAHEVQLDRRSSEAFVRQFLEMRDLEVRFDGTLVLQGKPVTALMASMVDEVLDLDRLDAANLADQMVLYAKYHGYPFKRGDIAAATREVIRAAQRERHKTVMRPFLVGSLAPAELNAAGHQWDQLGALFDMDPRLATAVLQHFIWQVLQKAVNRPVDHHLMPVIFSRIQGSGKTTFAKKFLSPLRDLASDAALLSDFADRRSADIYRFPAVLMDDLEKVPSSMVPILKSVLTAQRIRRRRLGSSFTAGITQSATLLGTANAPVSELIDDETGHRRFAMMPFRNGQVAKGGQEDVWKIVEAVDYDLLWRSVDAFQPSPIQPHLAALLLHQGAGQPESPLLRWLKTLDLQSEAVLRITTRYGVRAQGLHDLYVAQTNTSVSPKRFADEMQRYLLLPDGQFADKVRTESGVLYRPRPKAAAVSANPSDPSPSGAGDSVAAGAAGPSDPAALSDSLSPLLSINGSHPSYPNPADAAGPSEALSDA